MLAATAFAQSQPEFADPLEDLRIQIERNDGAPRDGAERSSSPVTTIAPGAATAGDTALGRTRDAALARAEDTRREALGFWGKMKASVSEVAASLGLPTSGLFGLLALILAGLAMLIGWTLFKSKARSSLSDMEDDTLYADSSRASKRRSLGDVSATAHPQEAAQSKTSFAETMPDDFEDIFLEEQKTVAASARTAKNEGPLDAADPATWRKPGLDRLRDSIRADWKADKAEKSPRAKTANDDEGMDFFEQDAPVRAAAEPARRTMADVSDGWDDWDSQRESEDDVWGDRTDVKPDSPAPSEDDDALARIRALRESLRAS